MRGNLNSVLGSRMDESDCVTEKVSGTTHIAYKNYIRHEIQIIFFSKVLFNCAQRVFRVPCQLLFLPGFKSTRCHGRQLEFAHFICRSSLRILQIPSEAVLCGAGSQECLVSAYTSNVIVIFMEKYKLWPSETRSERNYRSSNQ